jgi:hypothetical protein
VLARAIVQIPCWKQSTSVLFYPPACLFLPRKNFQSIKTAEVGVALAAKRVPTIRWHGRLEKEQVYERMKKATLLVVPSTWYEPFPMVLVEALATGLPILASRLGTISSVVNHGSTGLYFTPGDPADLASQVEWFYEHPHMASQMRESARLTFENQYTGEKNYGILMNIYRRTIERYGSVEQAQPGFEPLGTNGPELVQITNQISGAIPFPHSN